MHESITIPAGALQQPLRDFVVGTALAGCTHTRDVGAAVVVTANWPVTGWSTGERLLWHILASLANGDLRDAFVRLDVPNLSALCDVFGFMRQAVTA